MAIWYLGSTKHHFAPMDPALTFRGCENLPKERWNINIPDYYDTKKGGK